jgi:hypothetical protein
MRAQLAQNSDEQSGYHDAQENADKARNDVAIRHRRMFHDSPLFAAFFPFLQSLCAT